MVRSSFRGISSVNNRRLSVHPKTRKQTQNIERLFTKRATRLELRQLRSSIRIRLIRERTSYLIKSLSKGSQLISLVLRSITRLTMLPAKLIDTPSEQTDSGHQGHLRPKNCAEPDQTANKTNLASTNLISSLADRILQLVNTIKRIRSRLADTIGGFRGL